VAEGRTKPHVHPDEGMARRTSAPRLSYALRASDRREEAHCAGVNALLLDEGKGRLFSAARDACVRQWDVAADVPNCVTKYEAHAGWVHALAMVQEDVLVSASSDQCVRFWNTRTKDDERDGRCRLEANPSCGCEHEDYVVALAAATCAPRVVSGGLDAQAVLWDVTKARACAKLAPGRGEAEARSIYALACDASATLVVVGCTGGALRMWDTRTNGMVGWSDTSAFVGHADTVRCLALDTQALLCLSGSSDRTLRMWDVGTRRCITAAAPHRDSVWALQADETLAHAYTGGRDGRLCVTDMYAQSAKTIAQEERAIRAIAVEAGGMRVWTATDDACIRQWSVPDTTSPSAEADTPRRTRRLGRLVGGVGACALRSAAAEEDAFREAHVDDDFDASKVAPTKVIAGVPGIVACAVASDRMHVLSKDASGMVKRWNILQGMVVEDYGKADFDALLKELEEERTLQSWFTADTGLGTVSIHLEPPMCFASEAYAVDLGVRGAPHDLRVNIGEQVIKALFRTWRERRKALEDEARKCSNMLVSEESREDGLQAKKDRIFQKLPFDFSQHPPAIMSRGENGVPWKRELADFTGREGPDEIPMWIVDCLLYNRLQGVETLAQKCTFSLFPLEGSELPYLKQTKLTAPRILHVAKIKNYVVQKLLDSGVDLRAEAGIREGQSSSMAESLVVSDGLVDIIGNGKVLEPDMSLATICKYTCKRTNDIELFYCRRAENNEGVP